MSSQQALVDVGERVHVEVPRSGNSRSVRNLHTIEAEVVGAYARHCTVLLPSGIRESFTYDNVRRKVNGKLRRVLKNPSEKSIDRTWGIIREEIRAEFGEERPPLLQGPVVGERLDALKNRKREAEIAKGETREVASKKRRERIETAAKMYNNHKPLSEIARALGVAQSTANAYISVAIEQGLVERRWRDEFNTPEEHERLDRFVDLYESELTYEEIAEELGVNEKTVARYFKRAKRDGRIKPRGRGSRKPETVVAKAIAPIAERLDSLEALFRERQRQDDGADAQARALDERVKALEARLESIRGLPASVQTLYQKAAGIGNLIESIMKSVDGVDQRLGAVESTNQKIGEVEHKLMNTAVRVVELTDKLGQNGSEIGTMKSLTFALQGSVRRLEDDRRALATALTEVLNDLRYHQHGLGGFPVLPSAIPTPQYAGRIAELRDRSEVNVITKSAKHRRSGKS